MKYDYYHLLDIASSEFANYNDLDSGIIAFYSMLSVNPRGIHIAGVGYLQSALCTVHSLILNQLML